MLFLLPLAIAGTVVVGVEGPVDFRAEGATTTRCYARAGICIVSFPGEVPALLGLPGVRYVEEDRLLHDDRRLEVAPGRAEAERRLETTRGGRKAVRTPRTPEASPKQGGATPPPDDDPQGTDDCPSLWELAQIGVGDAWSVSGRAGAPIALVDSGFRSDHQDLSTSVLYEYDYGDGDAVAEVEEQVGVPDHGTFILGLLGANPENDDGRAGVIPDGEVALLKIADHFGNLYYSYAVEALAAVAEGEVPAKIVSYSLSGTGSDPAFLDAVEALGEAGVLLVTAAGNCSAPHCRDADNDVDAIYPGNYPGNHILVVANSDEDDALNSYSHYGATSVDLAAPGTDLCSFTATTAGSYTVASGTSYATPLVAGVASLVWGAWPDLTLSELRAVLLTSSAPSSALAGKVASGGRVDAAAAVGMAVHRLEAASELTIEDEGWLDVTFEAVAAPGVVRLLVLASEALSFAAEERPEAVSFMVGDTVDLGRDGNWIATVPGAILTLDLSEDMVSGGSYHTSGLPFIAREDGHTALYVRILPDDGVLGMPLSGEEDPSGGTAVMVTVTTKVTEKAGEEEEETGGCGCGGGATPGSFAGAAFLLLARRRRG